MPVFLVPLHEYNKCHNPDGADGGQFCGTGGGGSEGQKLVAAFGTTQLPENTHFITPDGQRIDLDKHKESHESSAKRIGSTLADVMKSGVVRSVGGGFEVMTPITDQQASLMADDAVWLGQQQGSDLLYVDVVDYGRKVIGHKAFDRPTADGIRNFVKNTLAGASSVQPVTPGAVTQKARVSVRASAYRDRPGFTIRGKDVHGRAVKVFTKTKDSAERIRKRLQAGLEVRSEDFK